MALPRGIITDLSHSKDLVVIARNSTEVYKGKPADIRQVGRDLNVKYVLEGSIQPLGDSGDCPAHRYKNRRPRFV